MKQIMMILLTTSLIISGCSDTKKKYLPFSSSEASGPTTTASAGAGTPLVAATNVVQATPTCSVSPCGPGDVVTITVEFTEAVNVTVNANGDLTLLLNNGQTATYVSGSGTKNLVFTYTVQAGNDVLALNYQDQNSLILANNATVTLVKSGNNADTTLPDPSGTGSMPSTNTVVIDTAVPTISTVSATTADGTYGKTQKVLVTVTLSESVIVTGTPTISLGTGNTSNGTATYVSGSGSNVLVFEYTVRAGDKVTDLNYVDTTSLALNGGTIKDAANNDTTLTLPATGLGTSLAGSKDINLDTTPTVASITTSTLNGSYSAGSTVNFTVTFTDAVTASGVTLTLSNGATATCASVTNSTTMVCTYTVSGSDVSTGDLTYNNTTSLTGGTVVSGVNPGLAANTTLPTPSTFAGSHDIVIVGTPTVYFTADTANSVSEAGGNYTLSFTLSSAIGTNVTFDVATGTTGAGATHAIAGTDFTGITQQVTIIAGTTSASVNIPISNDSVYEGNETFTATISNVSGNAVITAQPTQTVTINDNETAPTISLTGGTTEDISEGVGNYAFTVTLSGQSAVDTVITVNTANGSTNPANAGSDYTAITGGTITIPALSTSGSINIPITDDSLFEGGSGGTKETFTVTISSASSITGGAVQTVSITDNEATPTISFTDTTSKTVAENIGTYTLSVTLSGASSTATNVTVNTSNGTASAGSDYTAISSGTLTIPAGSTTGTIDITINNDSIFEGGSGGTAETFTVTLTGQSMTSGGSNVQTVSITDDEVAPTISFTAGTTNSVAENVGGGNYAVAFTLSGAASTDVTFTLASASGTATSGTDFTAYNQTVTITAGQTTKSVNVVITDDSSYEGSENFTLTMSGASSNATLAAGNVQTVTINDNEVAPTVSFTAGATNSIAENAGAGKYTVTFTLSAAAAADVTFTLATANGTATAGSDYTAYNQTVTIPAGQTSITVDITLSDDAIYEGNENFTLTMSGVSSNAALSATTVQTVTITENESAPTLSLSATTYSGAEGGNITITINRTGGTAIDATVNLATAITGTGVTHAISGTDYTAVNQSVNIPASVGNDSVTVNIATTADTTYENSETFTATISSPTGATLTGTTSATLTITNDDTAPTVAFTSGATNSVGEGAGNYVLNVTLSAASGIDTVITVNTANGTATAGSDYTALSTATITIPAGQTTGTINIPITDDTIYESGGNETFTATLSGVTMTGGASASQTISIIENDLGITNAITLDTDDDGKIDAYKIVFSENVTDSTFPGYAANANGSTQSAWLIAGYSGLVLSNGTAAASAATYAGDGSDAANDNIIYLRFTEDAADTGAKPDLTTTTTPGITAVSGSTLQQVQTVTLTEQDGAKAVIISAVGTQGSNSLTVTFSEAVYTTTGAPACTAGTDITVADTTFTDGNASSGATSFSAISEDCATDNIITYTTNNNLVVGDSADSISFAAGTVYDAADNQIATTAKTLTVNANTIPTLTLLEELDSDNNGSIDRVRLTFDIPMSDATISANLSQLTVGGLAVTSLESGTANDAQVTLVVSSSISDYSTTAFKEAIYTAGSWQSTLGGNLASFTYSAHNGSGVPRDLAAPIIISAVAADVAPYTADVDSGDTLTITFSETVSNYASIDNTNITSLLSLSSSQSWPTVSTAVWSNSNKTVTLTFGGSGTIADDTIITAVNTTNKFVDSANNFYASSATMTGSFTSDTTSPYISFVIDTTPATGASNNTILVKFSESVNSTTATTLANYTSLVKVSDSSSVSLTGAVITQVSSDTYKITLASGISLTSGAEYKLTATTSILDLAGNALTDPKDGSFIAQDALRVLAAKMTTTTTVQVIFSRLVDTSGSATCASSSACAVKYHFSPTLGNINSATVSDNVVTLTLATASTIARSYTFVGANGVTADDPTDASGTFDTAAGDAIKDSNGSGGAGAKTLSGNPQDRISFTALGTTINGFADGWYMSDPFADGSTFSFTFGFKNKVYVGPNVYNNSTLKFDTDGKNLVGVSYSFSATNAAVNCTTSGFGYGYTGANRTNCTTTGYNYSGPKYEEGLVGFNSIKFGSVETLMFGPLINNATNVYFTEDVDNRLDIKNFNLPSFTGGGNTRSIQTYYGDGTNMWVGFSSSQAPILLRVAPSSTSPVTFTQSAGWNSTMDSSPIIGTGAKFRYGTGSNMDPLGIDALVKYNNQLFIANSGGIVQSTTMLDASPSLTLTNATPQSFGCQNITVEATCIAETRCIWSSSGGGKCAPDSAKDGAVTLFMPGKAQIGAATYRDYPEGLVKVSPGQRGIPFLKVHNSKLYAVRNVAVGAGSDDLTITATNKTPKYAEVYVCATTSCAPTEWTLLFTSNSTVSDGTRFDSGKSDNKAISMFEISPTGVVYLGFDSPSGFRIYRNTFASANITNSGWVQQGGDGLDSGYTHIQSSAVVLDKGTTYYTYITAGSFSTDLVSNVSKIWYQPIKVYRQADNGTTQVAFGLFFIDSNLVAYIAKARKNVPTFLLLGIILGAMVSLGLRKKIFKH